MPHKLLLADDSVTIQRVVELTFADEDVQVIVAGDGRQAIERIEADRPDIVLADVGMPERDGYEVAAFVKGHPELAATPVLLLTGAFEPLDEQRARTVGCDGVLIKPFEPQVVIGRVKELLAGQGRRTMAAPAPPPAAVPPPDGPAGAAPSAADTASSDPLEEYFDRLDAAFASFGAVRPEAAPLSAEDPREAVRDLEGPAPAPATGSGDLARWDPVLPEEGREGQTHLASAFAALLAVEQGLESPASLAPAPAPPPVITDELIDRIAERVIARLADDSMRQLVAEIAERLVREEIERIKQMSGAGAAPPAR